MRVRLLIDVTVTEDEIPALQEKIADQPVVVFTINGDQTPTGGRLMGAQPVYEDE